MRAAGIRAGEGRILALVASLFAALEAGRGFGEVGLDTLVVSRFVLFSVLFFCVTFPFLQAASAAFPNEAVHSGNRRFAWRASKTEPATVQEIVPATAPEA